MYLKGPQDPGILSSRDPKVRDRELQGPRAPGTPSSRDWALKGCSGWRAHVWTRMGDQAPLQNQLPSGLFQPEAVLVRPQPGPGPAPG